MVFIMPQLGHGRMARVLLAALVAAAALSCQEVTPFVVGPTVTIDTTYVDPDLPEAQPRQVLLEDFTGVQCVNCPDAHELAEALSTAHPGLVVPVSEHNYFQGGFSNSDEDFRNDEAFAIDALIGPTTLWPIGTVNRKRFPGEPAVLLTLPKWTGYVEAELLEPPKVNVSLETDLDADARTLQVIAEAHFLETISQATRMSVMVLESGIVDPQQTVTGKVDDYEHNHVLRIMPTPATGAVITSSTEQGRVIRRGYTVELADHWNLNELEVVVFVHMGETDDKSVLQVAHAKP
jgi:hypothetical protein